MADPVSWLMIERGWEVVDRDGKRVGRVEETIGDSSVDIFDGLSIETSFLGRPRYVPAEQMVRRCLQRLDDGGIPGELRILRVLSDTKPVGTQGPVWYVGGKTV